MRDKVLCREWAVEKTVNNRKAFSRGGKGYSLVLMSFPIFLSGSVLVSIQGGAKMSINEVLGFFDCDQARIDQKAQRRLEISRQELDTIFVADSLFKGTVVDFGFGSHSGGGNYAKSFAIN